MAATVKSKQKSGYASYSMHVDVVTAASLDTTPSFLLELGLRRYLFNAGDGVQRFCLEHGVRLARCDHVFITRLDPTTLCVPLSSSVRSNPARPPSVVGSSRVMKT